MHLVTLIENSKGRESLQNQHGLSLFLKTGDKTILFDMGQDDTFLNNGRRIGIDPSSADVAIISHGHYDHGGGLEAFFQASHDTPLFLREGADQAFYTRVFNKFKYIGLDQKVLECYSDRLRWIHDDMEISRGIHALTTIERTESLPKGNRRLYILTKNGFENDPFTHELTCVIEEDDGLVVLTGCSHSGILNMVQAVKNRFPDTQIKAVIGGFHCIDNPLLRTLGANPSEIRTMAHRLKDLGCQRVITGHCTGTKSRHDPETRAWGPD